MPFLFLRSSRFSVPSLRPRPGPCLGSYREREQQRQRREPAKQRAWLFFQPSARKREGEGGTWEEFFFFSFLFRFSRPLFTFRPSLGGSLAVVSNELCLLLLFFSFLPAHFSLFHLIKTRIVTFFYHRRNERRERERERTGERRKRGAFFLHFFFFLWLMPSALTSLSRRPTSSR